MQLPTDGTMGITWRLQSTEVHRATNWHLKKTNTSAFCLIVVEESLSVLRNSRKRRDEDTGEEETGDEDSRLVLSDSKYSSKLTLLTKQSFLNSFKIFTFNNHLPFYIFSFTASRTNLNQTRGRCCTKIPELIILIPQHSITSSKFTDDLTIFIISNICCFLPQNFRQWTTL